VTVCYVVCSCFSGRYDIKMFQSFFQLHGKTFDYKIPMSTVLRLFILPHKDSRQMFYVVSSWVLGEVFIESTNPLICTWWTGVLFQVSLDPPIKQGQTRYHYLVFLFGQEEEIFIELPFTEYVKEGKMLLT